MDAKTRERYLGHAATSAAWYLNTQCTNERPWGPIGDLSDDGRFVYEIYKGSRKAQGSGVWAQALAIMQLWEASIATGNHFYIQAAQKGIRYLLSLQCLDVRRPDCQGAFWENIPYGSYSFPRDAATGCFALGYLAAQTGDDEYLQRAKMFCDWYMTHGSTDEDCWPWRQFEFADGRGHSSAMHADPGTDNWHQVECVDGDWQAGGALAYYYTGLLSGEKKYLDEGLRPILDKLVRIYDAHGDDPPKPGWHGESPIAYGNDDFAIISMIAGYRLWKDESYLKHIKKRIGKQLAMQAADGSYPNSGTTFVCSIEQLEYIKLAEEFGFNDYIEEVRQAVMKAAEFGFTLQERDLNDPLYYGGMYGQSSFGVQRDRIHQRSVAYSMNFYLKLAGGEYWPRSLSSYGWGDM